MDANLNNKSQQQKQIHDFLTSHHRNVPVLPFLRELSLQSVSILFDDILPMMPVVNVGSQPKQIIADFMQSILLGHKQLSSEFQQSGSQSGVVRSKLSIINSLISLPNHYVNLISQPKLNQDRLVNIANLQTYKQQLYFSLLTIAQSLQLESQILVINRLLVLSYHKTIAEYFLRNKRADFVVTHIANFSKIKKLITALYQSYILQNQKPSQNLDDLRKLLIDLANSAHDLSEPFYSLLNLDCKYYQQNLYKQFYSIIKNTKVYSKIFASLLKWWAVSKNYILTEMHSRLRCNLLYLFINDSDRKELIQGDLSVSIIQGIRRKLTDGASKSQGLLIWKTLSKKMDLPKTQEVEDAKQFQIIVEKNQEEHLQTESSLGQNKNNKIVGSAYMNKGKQYVQKADKAQQLDHNSQPTLKTNDQAQQQQNSEPQCIVIRPKNIYDCLLSLKNEGRQAVALQQLLLLIDKNQEDLVLMWNSLLQQLLCLIKQQYREVLVALLDKKPQQFIESVSCHFMRRETNVGQKMELMTILSQGIEKLSTTQAVEEKQQENNDFYFKKVRSRYLKQPETKLQDDQKQKRIEQRSRRWGHTRIQHQRKNKEVNLHIVDSISQINRFYSVANLIFYKIIDVFAIDIVNSLRKHQIFVQNLLSLLATFTSNIKNHFEKQILLTDICGYCWKIVQQLIKGNSAKRYQESGGQTMMLCLQVVNKVALVLDKFTNENVMGVLKLIVEGARKLPNYGMNSILDLIEANIYQKVYGLGES